MCRGCGVRTSPTAGTIFDRTRTPLTVWVLGWFATQKDGISALALQRALGIGSYQTAWAMLHRVRSVLVRPGRELPQGRVEVDETYIGGEEPGLRGGRGKGKKALVGIAVERVEPKGLGRCCMAWLRNASGGSLRGFLLDHVDRDATVISDGWKPYIAATADLYVHERVVVPGAKASDLMPGVHRVASLAKRWLLGTHQGAVEEPHLKLLGEFVFRFNRRRSRSRGMVFYRVLELAATHEPVRYRELTLNPRPSTTARVAPATRGRPQSLERPPVGTTPSLSRRLTGREEAPTRPAPLS